MKTTIGRGVVAMALVGASAACDGTQDGLIHRASLAQAHAYGVTECPQDLGAIEVQLGADARAPVTLLLHEDLIAIDVLDPELGWPINDGWAITMQPGQALVFPVQFNCGTTEDVAGSIVLETTPRGGTETLERASIPVALDIQGAP